MTAEPFPQPNTKPKCDIMPLTLTQAEIRMILRLRQMQGEIAVMVFVRDGLPHRLTVLPKTEVLA